ncbi:MAG: DUF1015 family protein [Acidobacteriota bacterium]
MATLTPFRALRPYPGDAARVAAVPYDVVTTEEARAQAGDNPLSFLRVSRAELELPPDADPHADEVYARAVRNFEELKQTVLVVEGEPSVYLYRLRQGPHEQTGVAACFSLDEYDRGIIKKHERTRRDKEDDRTRHMLALGAQTGPVFMVHRGQAAIDTLVAQASKGSPLFDIDAADGVRHTLWRLGGHDRDALVAAFAEIPALYIADGHHRAASAARARQEIRDRAIPRLSPGGDADSGTMLGVAFPHDQVQILPYHRTVRDFGTLEPRDFMTELRQRFDVAPGAAAPARRGEIAMYLEHSWHTLRPRVRPDSADPIRSLDVSILQSQLLESILQVGDVRTDPRIDFVGGARGTRELERRVDSGAAAVAFSLFPVSIGDLMAVSDAGEIMPPKSTWFEPKLRDGLLIHLI